ncbi:MAG: type II secretion system F family protein [Actinomycetota bacterium]
MAQTYAYKVRDRRGSLHTGEIEADSTDLVMAKLRELDYIPLEIKAKSQGMKREFHIIPPRVKIKDLAVFSRQFATMVNSGLPLLRTLAILEEQTESTKLAEVVGEMRLDVERGSSLSAAMAKHPKSFNRLYVSMCKAGEASGTLDTVLLRLADAAEREVALRQKIKSAMTYPVVVFGLVILILAAMLLFVVPTFEDLYSSLGGTLPLPTRILLAVSESFRSLFVFLVAGAILAAYLFRRWLKTPRGRARMDRFKLKAPIFGPLFHKTALSRFARTLGVLSRSGVPILQALDITAESVNNAVLAEAIKDIQGGVKEGESLAVPLSRHEIFPPMVVQMMAVGEETGALDNMLEKIADFYDAEVTAAVESLTSLIEPVMIAVVGGAVGLIVISLYMPLFNIINLIR